MNEDLSGTADVVLGETMAALGQRDHVLAQVRDAAVLTVAVVAAKSFAHNHARALGVRRGRRDLTTPRSTARFTRRLHALGGWLGLILATLGARFAQGEAFLRDSLPVPDCCGSCAAKRAQCCGWRRHRSGTTGGVPVAFALVPGGRHDRTPRHALTDGLPAGAAVDADKADNAGDDEATILADTGVRLVPRHTANMRPNDGAEKLALRAYRKRIATLYSQLTAMGLQLLHARTKVGLELKVHATLLAAVVTNGD